MKNIEALKLMMTEIVDEDNFTDGKIDDDVKVYSMLDLPNFEEYIERFNLDIEGAEHFNREDEYFRLDKGTLISLCEQEYEEHLSKHKDKIIKTYEKFGEETFLWNTTLIKEKILEEHLNTLDKLEEDMEVIYQDVELFAIAETLSDVSISKLSELLGYYGNWQIVKVDEMNYLIQV